MATKNIVPRANNEGSIGTASKQWSDVQTVKLNGATPLTSQTAIANANISCGLSTGLTALVSQVVTAGTYYYITDSKIMMPATYKTGWVVGSKITWRFCLSKSAAGTTNHIITVYRGTNGNNSDTKDVNYTLTGTAVIDELFFNVTIICTTAGANGAYWYSIVPSSILAATATGWGVVKTVVPYGLTGTVSSVDLTTASLIFGLGFYVQTGTPTITINSLTGQASNII